MQTKHLFVLIHIRNKVSLACQTRLSPTVFFYCPFQGGASFVYPLCYLYFMSVMLSCLLPAVLWSPAVKGLTSCFSCVL